MYLSYKFNDFFNIIFVIVYGLHNLYFIGRKILRKMLNLITTGCIERGKKLQRVFLNVKQVIFFKNN